MKITKYSANGNDFIIYHSNKRVDRGALAKKLCHRQNGVGADGLVVLLPHKDYDFEWDFYNSDGSYASMCGNASRAVAHYADEKGISKNGEAIFLTGAGVIKATINGLYVVTEMTQPKIIDREIEEYGHKWWLIDSGVPHLINIRDNIDEFDLEIMSNLRYKYDANVNIVSISGNDIYVRTYERGVENETLACGTGMVASFVRALEEGLVTSSIRALPRSGDELYLEFRDGKYYFGGKVTKTFVAEVEE
ncbi:Diaminopimelate epimerase [hydrothermal vent metagenome]|uniref:diaminopimelate epimerase n=1 Tax=hydrothermal vent metagenome TaxID=652676 RepID=A0A1W1EKI3_9ZZZZ